MSTESTPPWATIETLHAAYRSGSLSPSSCISGVLARIKSVHRDEIWITVFSTEALRGVGAKLDALLSTHGAKILEQFPLFGVPFSVKDNIDVKGLPTTAACPEYAYRPTASAGVVQRLIDAHAIPVGKTNLDQFATGLVGTRSPYGAVRHSTHPEYISGGSSSGSAVAVALGLTAFALGTDTAGSGRVPAGLNRIVGLKPSRGLVTTTGVLPACRALDCVAIFATTVSEAWRVLGIAAGVDMQDPYSRSLPMLAPKVRQTVLGVPAACEFFGDTEMKSAFERSIARLPEMTQTRMKSIEIAPLLAAAELLYKGPWIAERRAALGDFFDAHSAVMDPSVRAVIAEADRYTAVEAFEGEYRMAAYRRVAQEMFEGIDALVVPTAPIHPTIDEVLANPIELNSRLGLYTNFVNLLDMAAIAVPAMPRSDGLPSGVTLIGPAGSDHRLAVIAARLSAHFSGPDDCCAASISAEPLPFSEATFEVAVVGAHLNGQPLNWQLIECGARRIKVTATAPQYRLYALANTAPAKPGLVRSTSGGASIEVEVWQMPRRAFGDFMLQVGSPLGIGSLELADGSKVKGFICEPAALENAVDITHYGGWRAYLKMSSIQ